MIVVTGATGKLGKLIVEELASRMAPEKIGVSVRDPEKAADLQQRGIRVRHGDFAQPSTLSHAFAGASQLLMVSSNARVYGGDPLVQHRAAIAAARDAGVKRIVYTSQIASSESSAFPPAWDHAATEAMLASSGLAWTALRKRLLHGLCSVLYGKRVAERGRSRRQPMGGSHGRRTPILPPQRPQFLSE